MQSKKFTQIGTSSLILFGIVLLATAGVSGWMYVQSGYRFNSEMIALIYPIIIIVVSASMLSKLEIIISDKFVEYKFGGGMWSGKYKITDIKSVQHISYEIPVGFGMHIIDRGWIYNVSGKEVVELELNNGKRVQIGTDKPEEVVAEIQARITGNPIDTTSQFINSTTSKNWVNPLKKFGALFIIGIAVFAFYPEFIDTKTQLNENTLSIKGAYGLDIPYTSIEMLDTLSSLPKGSYRSDGYGGFRTFLGDYVMKDGSKAKLFIRKGSTPFLKIVTTDKSVIYLNYRKSSKTVELYKALKTKLNQL